MRTTARSRPHLAIRARSRELSVASATSRGGAPSDLETDISSAPRKQRLSNAVAVCAPQEHHFDAWAALFRPYRVFYKLTPDEAIVERVWSWIHDPGHETNALLAIEDAQVIGLAHYRRFARPSTGSVGLWLDDLFTDPEHRGNGIGRTLINTIADLSKRNDCSVVRWITAADNLPGQRLYDTFATKPTWITYDKTPW
ncbi:MAG: GNAT family N-acetyltransferase [Allobranchiibius sp.]